MKVSPSNPRCRFFISWKELAQHTNYFLALSSYDFHVQSSAFLELCDHCRSLSNKRLENDSGKFCREIKFDLWLEARHPAIKEGPQLFTNFSNFLFLFLYLGIIYPFIIHATVARIEFSRPRIIKILILFLHSYG